MSVFYNPKTKKVQPWIYVFFVFIPIAIIALLFFGSKQAVKKHKQQQKIEKERNVFEK